LRLPLDAADGRRLSPFGVPETPDVTVFDLAIASGRNFSLERADKQANVFEMAAKHIAGLRADGKRVFPRRLERGIADPPDPDSGGTFARRHRDGFGIGVAMALNRTVIPAAVLSIEHGFETEDFALVAEQDILGDRLVRHRRRKKASTSSPKSRRSAPAIWSSTPSTASAASKAWRPSKCRARRTPVCA
jgi:transcription-repair coupling factor (superfamily II helicase)